MSKQRPMLMSAQIVAKPDSCTCIRPENIPTMLSQQNCFYILITPRSRTLEIIQSRRAAVSAAAPQKISHASMSCTCGASNTGTSAYRTYMCRMHRFSNFANAIPETMLLQYARRANISTMQRGRPCSSMVRTFGLGPMVMAANFAE